MDSLENLKLFISRLALDSRLKPVHIALAIALCHRWISNQFPLQYSISRCILMKASRIRSKATYHKTIKELQQFGYLQYSPSYHPIKGTTVSMMMNGKIVDIDRVCNVI